MSIATDHLHATAPAADGPHPDPEGPASGQVSTPRRRALHWLAISVAASWALVLGAGRLGLDWALLPLLLIAVASVLRAGRGVVDRLILAGFSLAGLFIIGGLIFSVWPWRLSPTPVAGTLFTVIAVFAWAAGRRPQLPRRFDLSDLAVVGTGLAALAAALRPLWNVPYAERLLFIASSEDRSQHFAIFDTMHRIGGYLFMNQQESLRSVVGPTESVYPTGSHYIYAVIDTFIRSSTDPGTTLAGYNRYFLLVLAGFAFFLTAVVWAVRWAIGGYITGWRLTAVTSAVGAMLLTGWPMTLVVSGFDSEVAGLAFLAVTVGIALRPPPIMGEQVWLLGVGTVLVSYTYYLFLPFAAVAVIASLVVRRRQVRSRWRPVAAGAAILGPVALIPLYFLVTSQMDVGSYSLARGHSAPVSQFLLLSVAAAAAALLCTRFGRRSPRARVWYIQLAAAFAIVAAFGAFQLMNLGSTSYYFDKLVTGLLLIGIIGLGMLATLLRPMAPVAQGSRRPRLARVYEPALGLAIGLVAVTTAAGFQVGLAQTPLGRWSAGSTIAGPGPDLVELASRGLLGDGVTTIYLLRNRGDDNWRLTFLSASLNRNSGPQFPTTNRVIEINAGGSEVPPEVVRQAITTLESAIAISPNPVRVVVRDADTARQVAEALARRPDLDATVITLAGGR